MSEIITKGSGVSHAVWLCELAAAIEAAKLLTKFIGDRHHNPVELMMVKARIAAAGAEIEALRRARGGQRAGD